MHSNTLIKLHKLKKYFPVKSGIFSKVESYVKAVDGIDLKISEGETMGLVGESGCGKSTLGKTILKLLEPTDGKIIFRNNDITHYSASQMRPLRKEMQMIFQNPYGSLNPKMNVESLISEGMEIHHIGNGKSVRREKVTELLYKVGLGSDSMNKYPHEFSGGQRQRIAIARALAVEPDFVVCDEPVSALDVSVQAQIINLLSNLQNDFNLTYLFISHDLRVVKHISDSVAVMYLGEIVEFTSSEEIYKNPLHPYTKILISSVPDLGKKRKNGKFKIKGDVPNPANPPEGCKFHPRCPLAEDICGRVKPDLEEKNSNHYVSCHMV